MTMKRCFKCGRRKPLASFYPHRRMADGHLGKCKVCTKLDVAVRAEIKRDEISAYDRARARRPERKAKALQYQRTTRSRAPAKYRARSAVNNAVRDGRLVRRPCEVCSSPKAQAHHDDYTRPLDVRWLCFVHHRTHHGQRPTAVA